MEILFRGKRLSDGVWVAGTYHLADDGRTYIINGTIENACWEEVDPDTASMYTGLRDKHGELIYDGDIVRMLNQHFLIRWGSKNARFELRRLRREDDEERTKFLHTKDLPGGNVVGNKWDDPHLLEVW